MKVENCRDIMFCELNFKIMFFSLVSSVLSNGIIIDTSRFLSTKIIVDTICCLSTGIMVDFYIS